MSYMGGGTVREILLQRCERAGSQAAWSRQHGLAPQYVSEVIRGTRPPSQKVLEAIGLEKITGYAWKRDPWHRNAGMTSDECVAQLEAAMAAQDERAIDGWRMVVAYHAYAAFEDAEHIYKSAHEGVPSTEEETEAAKHYARSERLRKIEGIQPLFEDLRTTAEAQEAEDNPPEPDDDECEEGW